ncbi:MAG: transglycosylase SLT domain-containing protein [Acidiferrobacterales bacterium]|nr:transglycosylase SLT domain-containing protein [Acidiferrobacterales bacterium]
MTSSTDTKTLFQEIQILLRFIKTNIELLLISGLILVAAIQYYVRPQSQSYDEIVDSGILRVLIADEPDSQYVFNKQHYGFEYELLATFARSLNVELELVVVPYGELFTLLTAGAGDIAVGGILDTDFVHKVSQPTIPWFQAKTTVVYKRGSERPENLEEINSETVLSSARYYGLRNFDSLQLTDDHRSEYEILNAVATGQDRFALTTDYRARNAKHYLPDISRSFILPDKVDLVWSLPNKYDEKLLAVLNQFLQTAIDKSLPEQLESYYLGLPTSLSRFDALILYKNIHERLPEFEPLFRSAARKAGLDWTLLAAMAYQESRWSNDAESPTGVRGIMQITSATADFLNIDDRLNIDQSIDAAAEYVFYLKSRLPDEIKEPQRTWFAVGAYNVGLKHVRAGHQKAVELDLESTQWNTISQILPTLYGKRFRNGEQAKTYVERVQIFTDILRFYDSHLREKIDYKKEPEIEITYQGAT